MFIGDTHILRGRFYRWKKKQFLCIFAGVVAAAAVDIIDRRGLLFLHYTICELDEFDMNSYTTPKEKCEMPQTH